MGYLVLICLRSVFKRIRLGIVNESRKKSRTNNASLITLQLPITKAMTSSFHSSKKSKKMLSPHNMNDKHEFKKATITLAFGLKRSTKAGLPTRQSG